MQMSTWFEAATRGGTMYDSRWPCMHMSTWFEAATRGGTMYDLGWSQDHPELGNFFNTLKNKF